jgi:hypothetical protein
MNFRVSSVKILGNAVYGLSVSQNVHEEKALYKAITSSVEAPNWVWV